MGFPSLTTAAALALYATAVAKAGALVDFSASDISALVQADAAFGDKTDSEGGPFSGFYADGLALSVFAGVGGPDINYAVSGATQWTTFTPTTITSLFFAGVDTQSENGLLGVASAVSRLVVVFDLPHAAQWAFPQGVIGVGEAVASVSLVGSGGTVFEFTSDFNGASGSIPAGRYTFTAEASAFSSTDDPAGGVNGAATISYEFSIIPAPAAAAPFGALALFALRRRPAAQRR